MTKERNTCITSYVLNLREMRDNDALNRGSALKLAKRTNRKDRLLVKDIIPWYVLPHTLITSVPGLMLIYFYDELWSKDIMLPDVLDVAKKYHKCKEDIKLR